MMKKIVFAAAMLCFSAAEGFAGGLLTNTNQNIAFNRMMSREASIGIDGVYSNPAGVAFLGDGYYLSLNIQSAFQTRTIKNDYPLFANNLNAPTTPREFEGKATAPIIPSFQMAYNKGKISYQFGFGVTGGGGKCTFDNGLGSFEHVISDLAFGGVFKSIFSNKVKEMVPGLVPGFVAQGMTEEDAVAAATTAATQGLQGNAEAMAAMANAAMQNGKYTYDAYMKGRQYYFGAQLGVAYKFSDQFSAYAGVRTNYALNNYYGYVRNITVAGQKQDMEIALNCDQTGLGFTPIISVDYKPNKHWNFAARYECKTRMRLKNESVNIMPEGEEAAAVRSALSKFEDGKSVAEDIPALLTIGAGYSPMDALRINAGFHYFYDRQATAYNNINRKLDRGTMEFNAGAEYDVCKKLTVSAGWQNTSYGTTDEYMDDKSFVTSSNSLGCGVCYHLNDKIDINLAYFSTFYQHHKTTEKDAVTGLDYNSDYCRTNRVLGVGVDLKF